MLTQTATEKLEHLQTQLTRLKESPQPTKHADQQKLSKDCQHLQQQIDNFQTFLCLEVGQQVTDGKQIGAIASLSLSPGGLPEAWVSWYGKVPIPEQPTRLKPEPLLVLNIKVGEEISINLNHPTDAGKTFEIAEFRGEGWILATTGHLFHYDSFCINLESDCQHQWNRTWSTDNRAVKVCQLCRLTFEIESESELKELLSSLEELRQELVDLAAVSKPSKAKDLMQGVKDKDEQIAWVKQKLTVLSSQAREAQTMSQIQIDPEFKSLIPPLSPQERKQLEDNLLTYGCRDSLVVWKDHNLLLDGHNRYEICLSHQIEFNTVEIDFPDREAAISWIIDNQLGRRNLTPEAASYLRGTLYNLRKKQGQRTDLTSRQSGAKLTSRQSDPQNTSRQSGAKLSQQMANEYKVGSRTIERDAQYASAVDTLAQYVGEPVRQRLLNRESKLSQKNALNLAKIAITNPEEAQNALNVLTTGAPLSVAPHLQLAPGTLVEISAPKNPKIHERYGRVAAVHENRVDVWVRDTEMMEMNKYQLKFNQVEAVPLEKEPQLAQITQRIERLRQLNLDPFEQDLLSLLERPVVLTPVEKDYLAVIEQRHGLS